MIYVALATKLENYKKKRKLFVNPYIHMLPEKGIHDICGTSYKTRKLQKKKGIHDICSCYSCMFRCCTNGRGSVPSVISKEHPLTGAAYS